MRLMASSQAVGEVVNVGNDREVSIDELALLVKTVANSESEITHIPYDVAYGPGFEDLQRRVPCVDKLFRLTGYRPHTPLDAIVKSVIAHGRTMLPEHSPALAATAAGQPQPA
jgi:UDP-glucose 4-epimerase